MYVRYTQNLDTSCLSSVFSHSGSVVSVRIPTLTSMGHMSYIMAGGPVDPLVSLPTLTHTSFPYPPEHTPLVSLITFTQCSQPSSGYSKLQAQHGLNAEEFTKEAKQDYNVLQRRGFATKAADLTVRSTIYKLHSFSSFMHIFAPGPGLYTGRPGHVLLWMFRADRLEYNRLGDCTLRADPLLPLFGRPFLLPGR
jgi:hypothetical protein